MKHRVVDELHFVSIFVGLVWGVFILDVVIPGSFSSFELVPRSVSHLYGILSMPFLHADWGHIVGNTLPLVVLLCLLAGSRANTYRIVPGIIVLGGVLLWLFGRPRTSHAGASGLVYGLMAFLIVSGVREGRLKEMAIAIFVGVTFGATLLSGVLPMTVDEGVSWDGHLTGAIAGALIGRFGFKASREQQVTSVTTSS